jgi:hypothetical protein
LGVSARLPSSTSSFRVFLFAFAADDCDRLARDSDSISPRSYFKPFSAIKRESLDQVCGEEDDIDIVDLEGLEGQVF